jgi:ATP-dependent exoDNAse (exonuclease V) alpha subunit
MRERYHATVDVDTCHAAFGFQEAPTEMPGLGLYDLVVVDEISQLDARQYEHIRRLWNSVEKVPTLVLLGDPWQMSGLGEQRPWHAPTWKRTTFVTKLKKSHRVQGDRTFLETLDTLRVSKPDARLLRRLQRMRFRGGAVVDAVTVRRLLTKHRNTTLLTITRRGAHVVNVHALRAKFPRRRPLARIDADLEANPENFDPRTGSLHTDHRKLKPLRMPIHRGLAVYLTKNLRKDVDFVNGMSAVVEGYDHRSKAVRVLTATGRRLAITTWTDVDHGCKRYFPLRLGYCSTILKFQGAELDDVTIVLDAPGVPGAAYTAMSRVRTARSCRFLGKVTRDRFVPVDVSL